MKAVYYSQINRENTKSPSDREHIPRGAYKKDDVIILHTDLTKVP
jgi:hypothetical protein